MGPFSFLAFCKLAHSALQEQVILAVLIMAAFKVSCSGLMLHIDISCLYQKVFGESVVGDVGYPLESPFFRLEDFWCYVGDLGDIAHRWGDTLCVEVGA